MTDAIFPPSDHLQLKTAGDSWQAVLAQLQREMPRAAFDAWVRDTRVVSCLDDELVIGSPSQEACDWLESRLASISARMLIGILKRSVKVVFVVDQPVEEEHQQAGEGGSPGTDEADIQAVTRLSYDEVVVPARVVAIPGYFSRLIPEIGARSAWLYVGFRQAVWSREHGTGGWCSRRIPVRRITRFSGLSRRTYFRMIEDPATWEGLAGLVERRDVAPCWQRGSDQRLHRAPNRYAVQMGLRLSHADAEAIREWLVARVQGGTALLEALRLAAGVNDLLGELLPPPGIKALQPTTQQTVMDIACELHGGILSGELEQAAQALHCRVIAAFGTILITHYFLEKVIPAASLTPPQAWLVTLLRDRCYVNRQSGEVRDEVCVRGGYAEMADWLGLSRAKTIWEWLRDPQGALGGFVTLLPGRESDEPDSLRLKVRLEEPLFEGVNGTDPEAPVAPLPGADGTFSAAPVAPLKGAAGTGGWREWHTLKLLSTDSSSHPSTQPAASPAAAPSSLCKTAGVPPGWVLRKLLVQNHAHPRAVKTLLGQHASATALVSWLLYATSTLGIGVKDPFAYALACLQEDPQADAGGAFKRLAELPPAELIGLIDRAAKTRLELAARGGTGSQDWDTAMGLANPELRTLRILLLGDPNP